MAGTLRLFADVGLRRRFRSADTVPIIHRSSLGDRAYTGGRFPYPDGRCALFRLPFVTPPFHLQASHCSHLSQSHTIVSALAVIVATCNSQPPYTCMESATFFVPSTSFCSLSFWLTLSCAHNLITVPLHLRSRHLILSLPRPFTPNLKFICCFTNPFRGLSGSIFTSFLNLYRTKYGHWRLFVVVPSFFVFCFILGCVS